MRYIKTYENSKNPKYWYIKGDYIKITRIVTILMEERPELSEILNEISKISINKIMDLCGLYIFKDVPGWQPTEDVIFWCIWKDSESDDMEKGKKGATYQGEYKIKNDKVILDTFDIDINRYNL